MPRILYALSGQGRGHTSRVMAMLEGLRAHGHDIHLACGGTARAVFEAEGEPVLAVPALYQVLDGNKLRVLRTGARNAARVLAGPATVRRLAERVEALAPDLVVTDFEVFVPRAAARVGIPVVSLNHQEVITQTRYRLPLRHSAGKLFIQTVVHAIAPRRPAARIISTFFFPPLRRPGSAVLVGPILRRAVREARPTTGADVLVYVNFADGAERLLDALARVDARFVVYGYDTPARAAERFPNLAFRAPSIDGFLADLAGCRAVVCTAGFTLLSECLHLGKPALAVPNRGIFEQTLNALMLERTGLGEAVIDQPLTADRVAGFLARVGRYEDRLSRHHLDPGNEAALGVLERVLRGRTAPALREAALA